MITHPPLHFLKMHGLGNDFIVIDARTSPLSLTAASARLLADRRFGIGCDLIAILERSEKADLFMWMLNADGTEAGACGNVTRCVGRLLLDETGKSCVTIETVSGLLAAEDAGNGLVTVNMGQARLDPAALPVLAEDTLHLPLSCGPLTDPVGISMGNPHAVFFVDDIHDIPLEQLGPKLEHDPIFPQRCNIEIAHVLAPDRIRMRVWERGCGITLACGSGACATLVAAARRGLTGRKAEVVLDGGSLWIEWCEDGSVRMTGPAVRVFSGTLDPAVLGA